MLGLCRHAAWQFGFRAGRFGPYRDRWGYFGPALMFSTSGNAVPNTNGRKDHLR